MKRPEVRGNLEERHSQASVAERRARIWDMRRPSQRVAAECEQAGPYGP